MGCDIHARVEVRENGVWKEIDPGFPSEHPEWGKRCNPVWDFRVYGAFAVLAGVRNYSAVEPISQPRGLPADTSCKDLDDYNLHSASWYTLDELLKFDWNKPCEDRRVSRQTASGLISGAETCAPGEGEMTTYRDMMPDSFFKDLYRLNELGYDPCDIRIVFAFDN